MSIGEAKAAARRRDGRGQPAPGDLDREEVHQPRPAVPRPDPGRQHRPDEGGRQVRIPPRLQVLDLRHLVDPPAITRSIADQARTIRIPVHMIETINKLNRISRQMIQEMGREPTPEELAERMEMPEDKVRKVLKIAKEPISMETPIGDDEDSHLGDFIEDQQAIGRRRSTPRPWKACAEATQNMLAGLTRARPRCCACASASI